MKSIGIIAEYNPFHNGHLYHLEKIKEKYPDHAIILVLNGNFTQRGEPSIIDKWRKTEIALEMGIDLVVELPFVFGTQSADFFSYGAISILEHLKVDKVIFGSETNDINLFHTLVDTQLEHEEFDSLVKVYLRMGENYPTALSLALEELTGKTMSMPNDLLGISYIKAIKSNNYKIKAECIKRTSSYNTEILDEITSAKAIRKAIIDDKDISKSVPELVIPYLNKFSFQQEKYFPFLKYKILTEKVLDKYQTVDEGIDKKLKKEIINCKSYAELIDRLKSKRYTHNKINRMLLHILCSFTKKEAEENRNISYIRILGFNELGRKYLNTVKKDMEVPIISKFCENHPNMLDIELRATMVYASILNEEDKKKLIEKEFQSHPIIKKEGI